MPDRQEGVRLPASERIERFLAAAADRGLDAATATELGLERFFALADIGAAGFDVEAARRLLFEAVPRITTRPLPAGAAARLRSLTLTRPVVPPRLGQGITVPLPDRLLTRMGNRVPARALHASFVPEMVGWEIAAVVDGRSMAEWVLATVARAQSRDRGVAY